MPFNVFKTLRKPGYTNFLIAGLMSNLMVFAEPVQRASSNLLFEKNFRIHFHKNTFHKPEADTNTIEPVEGTLKTVENNVNPDKPRTTVKSSKENESLSTNSNLKRKAPQQAQNNTFNDLSEYFVFYAKEEQGKIGIEEVFYPENPHDNFFNIVIPENISIDKYDVILSYDLFGLNEAANTTKSINGNEAYGGKIITKDNAWKEVQEQIQPTHLKQGPNEIFFTRRADIPYTYFIKNVKLTLVEKKDAPITLVTAKAIHNNNQVYIVGTSTLHTNGAITIAGKTVPVKNGVIDYFLDIENLEGEKLTVQYQEEGMINSYHYPVTSEEADLEEIIFQDEFLTQSKLFGLNTPSTDFQFQSITIETTYKEYFKDNAAILVQGLNFKDMKPLNQDLVNVTSGVYEAYRVSGTQIEDTASVKMHLEFDEQLIPTGYTAKDIRTFYYDASARNWKALPLESLKMEGNSVVSLITDPGGETDYINGIIKVSENPETSNFVPTAMSDIEFANPSQGVVSIPPPSPNNMGAASTSFPIKLPPGRNGLQPSLEVAYNSEGRNGWMGMGWDIQTPAINVNTKWGIPFFDPTYESEVFSLNGQDLVFMNNGEYTSPHRINEDILRQPNKQFYLRKEGSYNTIVRKGSSPQNYWWEVTDKFGNKSFYGGYQGSVVDNAVIKDGEGRIAHWALYRQEDPYGNYIKYSYDKDEVMLGLTISAQEFYLSKVEYTLATGVNTNYVVNFKRNQYSVGQPTSSLEREDISTNARYGLLQITKDLLTEIEVAYFDGFQKQAIRTYRFDYAEGDFKKQLLTRISEFDTQGNLFYSNTMEYFKINNDPLINNTETLWNGNSETISSTLHNIATGGFGDNIPKGSALGTNTSKGNSFGLRAGLGLGTNFTSVANTIGGSYNYSRNEQTTRISFIDINGDGLPDKVYYNNNGGVYYRPNTGEGFGNLMLVDGATSLDKSISKSHGTGYDANLLGLIGVGKSRSKTKTTTNHYFADFNGDGLPDLLSNNRVKFNVTQENSDYTLRSFDDNAVNDTENPIVSGAIDPALLEYLQLESMDELREQHSQFDHVKVWRAPYKGTVNIASQAKLVAKNIDADNNVNKFRLTIERAGSQQTNGTTTPLGNAIQLESLTGPATTIDEDNVLVEKGEYLFFRVHNLGYGYGGEVKWNPTITYTSTDNFPYITHDDENGKLMNVFEAEGDFIMNNDLSWGPHQNDASVLLDFNISISELSAIDLSDDIHFKIKKYQVDLNDGSVQLTNTWTLSYDHIDSSLSGTTGTFTTNVDATNSNFVFSFEAESDSNVAWDEINWKPVVSGENTGVVNPPVNYKVYDDNVNEEKYWFNANQLIDPIIDPQVPGDEQNPFMELKHNMFDLDHTNLLNTYFNEDEPLPVKINWVVKKKEGNVTQVLHRETFYLQAELVGTWVPSWVYIFTKEADPTSDQIDPATDTEYFQYSISKENIEAIYNTPGSRLYSAFYIDNKNFGKNNVTSTTLSLHPDIQGVSFPPISLQKTFHSITHSFYGIPYRGWGQFLYNGGLAFEYNEEGEITNPGSPDVFDGNIDMSIFDFEGEAAGIQDEIDNANPEAMDLNGETIRYTFYSQDQPDQMYENPSIITAKYGYNLDGDLTSTVGRFGESNLHDLYLTADDLLDDTPGAFVGFKQLSESKGKAKSGNLVTVSGTDSEAKSVVLNQYIDLNGDRYPDIITGGKIQYTNLRGGLSGTTLNNENGFVSGSFNEDNTHGVTISGMNPKSDQGKSQKNPIISNISAGINTGDGSTSNVKQWTDMNGDGLPDQVLIEDHAVKVRLNVGYGSFTEEMIPWGSGYGTLLTSERDNLGLGAPLPISASFAAGFGGGQSTSAMNTLLTDVNGDGLPDLVISTQNGFEYYLNTGTGFDDVPQPFYGGGEVEEDVSVSGNVYASFTTGFMIPIPFAPIKVTFTPSFGLNAAFSEKRVTVQDINGDGLPDILTGEDDNASVSARLNQVGKNNLLYKVNTPLGGSWEVDYELTENTYDLPHSKWVMNRIITHDGFTDEAAPTFDETLTTLVYDAGKHDRREREFLGFETLRVEQRHPSSELIYRYTEKKYHNTSYYLKGAVKETAVYTDADEMLSLTRMFYNLLNPDTPVVETNVNIDAVYQQPLSGDPDYSRLLAVPVKTITTSFEDGQNLNLVQLFNEYDGQGNITRYRNNGSTFDDAYRTEIEYEDIDFPGLPTKISVFKNQGNVLLREREAIYNNNGKLHQIIVNLGDNETNTVEFAYDSYGNTTQVKQLDNLGALGGYFTQTIGYDTAVKTYPVSFSDSFNQQSSSVYNYLFGVPVYVTDMNGISMRTRIDNRGRVIEVTGPYELPNGWTIRNEYKGEASVHEQIGGAGPNDYMISNAQGSFVAVEPGTDPLTNAQHHAVTRHFDPDNALNEILTVSIVDGFGQAIQLKKTHNSDAMKWLVSGYEEKDAYGRVLKSFLPVVQGNYPTNLYGLTSSDMSYFDVQDINEVPAVEMDYDERDRQLFVKQPGEELQTSFEYAIVDGMFSTRVTNENTFGQDQVQESFTDVRGRKRKVVQNDEITTQFYYNTINELIKVKNTKGYETVYEYDLAGRRILEKHPDRGITSYTYNNAGALTEKKTANLSQPNQTGVITYQYNYHRLTEINYPHHPENDVKYTYGSALTSGPDEYNIGRLIRQEDATGIQEFNYGKLGELIETIRGVAVAGKLSYWFKTEWIYDSWNRISKIYYPDGETVDYQYDKAGQLNNIARDIPGVNAPRYIVENISYTDYGERASILYGNGTKTTYDYDIRRRLDNIEHTLPVPASPGDPYFQIHKKYTYDALSNILNIETVNITSPISGKLGGPVNHTYKYDDYNRLIDANGSYVGPGDATPELLRHEYTLDMLYDVDHTILSKKQTHIKGAINSLNDPISQVIPVMTTSYDLEYDGYASGSQVAGDYNYVQPHAPREITEFPNHDYNDDPNDPRIKRQFVDYDANGNMVSTTQRVSDPNEPTGTIDIILRQNLWDEEDRLRAVDLVPEADIDKPEVAVYTYDAGGERTIKYAPGRFDARYSAKETGNAHTLKATVYPSPLLTVIPLELPDRVRPDILDQFPLTKYTKHYYIGSERIHSALGTVNNLGLLCEDMEVSTAVVQLVDQKVIDASDAIVADHLKFDKEIFISPQVLYGTTEAFTCSFQHNDKVFAAYWYHPDHLGSSSYITNLAGDITQHMEYLPFGETLVEEHLNSNNSPYKFNAKELDEETGWYYYGARYYDPKWSVWLSVDPMAERGPQYSPYIYTFNNPINFTDPDGRWPDPPTWAKFKNIWGSLSKNSTVYVFQEIPQRNSRGTIMSLPPSQRTYNKILLNQGTKAGSPMIYLTESISSTSYGRPGFTYGKQEGTTTSQEIGFVGNQNTLLNDDFSSIAQNIIDTGSIVDIQGRTSLDDGQTIVGGATINGVERGDYTSNDLVQARAETIYNQLLDNGVPEDQLNIVQPEFNATKDGKGTNTTILSINQKPELVGIKPEQIKE
tara:strand:- start:1125 stop:11606 length:10482 start_codon:yes stop_codon:yes gene_type:complete